MRSARDVGEEKKDRNKKGDSDATNGRKSEWLRAGVSYNRGVFARFVCALISGGNLISIASFGAVVTCKCYCRGG
jgi:hypothetical protein